jgi:RNA polymerase sigma factor (sigma-70 family)
MTGSPGAQPSGSGAARYHPDVVAAFSAGSQRAFALVWDVHVREVHGFCLRRCATSLEAEDLVSVVFLEAWRCRGRAVLVDGTLRPWLYGIAVNVMRNESRRQRRYGDVMRRFHAANPDLADGDHADDVVTAVTAAASRHLVAAAFAQLSGKERAVAELVLVEGLDVRAAAAALSLTESVAKSRLAAARKRLQRLLRTSELTDLPRATGHEQGEWHIAASVTQVQVS